MSELSGFVLAFVVISGIIFAAILGLFLYTVVRPAHHKA